MIEDETKEYAAFVTAFLAAEQITDDIDSCGDADIRMAYYYLPVINFNGDVDDEKVSLNTAFYQMRTLYVQLLTSLYMGTESHFVLLADLYTENLWTIAQKADHAIWAYLYEDEFDGHKVKEALGTFIALTAEEKAIWYSAVNYKGTFRAALLAFAKGDFGTDAQLAVAAEKLFVLEKAVLDLWSGTDVQPAKAALTALNGALQALSSEQKTAFDGLLGVLRQYYVDLLEGVQIS